MGIAARRRQRQSLSVAGAGEDPAGLWNMPEYYRKIDAAMIKDAANLYLNMNNRVRVTLVPESKPKE